MKYDPHYFTYGAEHEWADWPLFRTLPEGYGRDRKDITIVNSNGVANDPTGKFYRFGGEINTPPTTTLLGQIDCLQELKNLLPEATINYRSNLHLHIRIPGLKEDLEMLKQIQLYIHENMPLCFPIIQPMPRPKREENESLESYNGHLRRWKRRKVSHQTLLTKKRLELQLSANTVEKFFNSEPPQSKAGKPLWHCQPRLCVNLRQLLETDTIEFRHFAGTLSKEELETCLCWCFDFIMAALKNKPIQQVLAKYRTVPFPKFPKYDHELERRYRATVHDGTIPKNQIVANINAILKGTFI